MPKHPTLFYEHSHQGWDHLAKLHFSNRCSVNSCEGNKCTKCCMEQSAAPWGGVGWQGECVLRDHDL